MFFPLVRKNLTKAAMPSDTQLSREYSLKSFIFPWRVFSCRLSLACVLGFVKN